MAEAVGGAILSAVLQALFDSLASPQVVDFFHKNHSVVESLDKLKIVLGSAKALLNDAEDKQIKDVNIKSWVDELNEVFHQADDVIAEINTEALWHEINKRSQCFSVSAKMLEKVIRKTSLREKTTNEKIEKVIERLNFLLEQKDSLGLKGGVSSKRLDRSPIPLIGDPCDIYGRQDDKELIVKLVLSENIDGDNNKISVIPIVGMGGIGKTTLARFVYDDSRVKKHFEYKCAWITISDDFDVQRLEKLIFKGLTFEDPVAEESGERKEELKKKLGGKKFLLVLDDVWNENYNKWHALRSFLQMEAGSKIIVTTRNEKIARMMSNVQFHRLQTLSDENCWDLFQKHVFHGKKPIAELEKIGIDIVKKCRGVPLAVMSVAGLLCSVSNLNEWKEVLESDIWELQRKGNNEILPSLWLSYSYLPSALKRCFAYCSIFPKDYEYEEKEIILLWMAEGIIQGENKEQIGEEYIKVLVSRSLFQRSTKNESSFIMHDLVHDLATFASGEGFCLRLDKSNGLNNITNKTRHLLYWTVHEDLENLKKYSSRVKNLRTFLVVPTRQYCIDIDVLLKKFECLRVLCLCTSTIKNVPNTIGNLKHLRYLDLSYTEIQELPNRVCTLYNLQTLLLCKCGSLNRLPRNINKLINLRHLDISGTYSLKHMPPGIGNLKSLRSLTKFVLSNKPSGCKINELGDLPNLCGKLEISGLENVVNVEDVSKADFLKKSPTDLRLMWSDETNDPQNGREILDALQPHHANLKIFHVNGYGGKRFSNWIGDLSFSNTTMVFLVNCNNCCHLPPLGQLPLLKNLVISAFGSIEMIGSEFYSSSNIEKTNYVPFKSLENLTFRRMKAWQRWTLNGDDNSEARAFPCLEKLTLEDCPKLESPLPHCFPSLEELCILTCNEMEALLPSGQTMNTAFPSMNLMNILSSQRLEFARILPFPSTLNTLCLWNCEKILEQRMQWGLKALQELKIIICGDVELGDSFPEEEVIPTTVRRMEIWDAPNLKGLNGKVFQQLTSLTHLDIRYCPELRCFPEQGLPASLLELYVSGCLKITDRMKKDTGEDWHKISHIPQILVNGEIISSP